MFMNRKIYYFSFILIHKQRSNESVTYVFWVGFLVCMHASEQAGSQAQRELIFFFAHFLLSPSNVIQLKMGVENQMKHSNSIKLYLFMYLPIDKLFTVFFSHLHIHFQFDFFLR